MTQRRFLGRDSAVLAFVATTAALVLVASASTAFLVRFGAADGVVRHHNGLAAGAPLTEPRPTTTSVMVDRVVGTFPTAAPVVRSAQQQNLAELLSPRAPAAATPLPSPSDSPQPAPLVPPAPTIPAPPAPTPTPPTVRPPLLPLPAPLLPLPIPLPTVPPIPLPLPLPLPSP